MRASAAICLLSVVLLGFAGCSQHSKIPQLPHQAKLFSDAVKPVDYRLQRFSIDSSGQAYGAAGNKLYRIDSINDNLVELYEFDASILGFHITSNNVFIISTDNNHWNENVPCNIYASKSGGKKFARIKTINGGCPVWMSISSDQDYIYIGEYGPKDPYLSKNVWKYDPDTGKWDTVFQAPLESEAHIHRVGVDPYTNYLWVTVGDTRKNRGAFLSRDQGKSWVEVLDTQATGVAFSAEKIYWGEDKKDYGGVFSTDSQGRRPVTVFNTKDFGNYAGSIYELVALPDDTLLVPVMKYADSSNVASLWYSDTEQWELLIIFESLPGQGKDTSSIAGPDKNGFVLLTGYKINWHQL